MRACTHYDTYTDLLYLHTSYVQTYIHTHVYTCIHTYIHTCLHTNMYIHTYIHTYILKHKDVIHTYMHTHTHTHIWTITPALPSLTQQIFNRRSLPVRNTRLHSRQAVENRQFCAVSFHIYADWWAKVVCVPCKQCWSCAVSERYWKRPSTIIRLEHVCAYASTIHQLIQFPRLRHNGTLERYCLKQAINHVLMCFWTALEYVTIAYSGVKSSRQSQQLLIFHPV